ncbi:GAF and ANTAR domain-containing protein [Nitriliruptor alkaliphilus]|uniref:GAF and ANTAR domain-containing protein n=1 Tax=Nitriliruptor alkaliphilus TaxID=427918 RepID=UPI0006962571|nr:GAF and ANTAR domain-containing protein [Nitriliruptor alkaliphilus]
MTADDQGAATTYAAALRSLAQVLVDAPSLRSTLDELLAVAVIAAPDVSALTVTAITDDGALTSAASTDEHAQAVDEFEYAIEEGPCIEALATGEEQLVRDTGTDLRWPRFNDQARKEGFGSVAGLPLRATDGATIGALNVFSPDVDGLREEDLAVLRRVCAPAAAVLTNARAYRRTRAISEQLETELDERALVNRAIGAVLGRTGGDPAGVHRAMVATADREGVSLRDLAERVIAGEVPPAPPR